MALGALMGISLGADALSRFYSASLEKKALDKERAAAEKVMRERRKMPEVEQARRTYGDYAEELKRLPGELRREREGRLSSLERETWNRLQRTLASAGVTGGSGIATREMRKTQTGLERQAESERLAEAQQLQGARAGQIGLAQQISNMLYPSAGQVFPQTLQESYIDYPSMASDTLQTALMLSELGK